MEFVEMFKAPIKVLHPLLTATQEGNYNSTEGLGAIPYSGILLAHPTSRSGTASATTRTTRPSSTASTSSRCRTACASPDEIKIYDKLLANAARCPELIARRTR